MKTRTLVTAALLLSATGAGVALAAVESEHTGLFGLSHHEQRTEGAHAKTDGWLRFAERHDRDDDEDHGGRHHEDDEDDDDDEDDGPAGRALPQTGPSDPNAPVPDNGLFNGKARPKVEVQ